MNLFFITSNSGKFFELKSIIPSVKQLDIELPEIQEIDAKEIIKAKLQEAFKLREGEFIVEDTSLYLDCLNGLPGPLIKWFLNTIGNSGLVQLTELLNNTGALAKTIIGYADPHGHIQFFEGNIRGKIIAPRGTSGFGWDPIFQPDNHQNTFAELSKSEKNNISMRRIAAEKLRDYLRYTAGQGRSL